MTTDSSGRQRRGRVEIALTAIAFAVTIGSFIAITGGDVLLAVGAGGVAALLYLVEVAMGRVSAREWAIIGVALLLLVAGALAIRVLTGDQQSVTEVVDNREIGVSGGPNSLASDEDGVWVASTDGKLSRLNEHRVVDEVQLPVGLFDVAAGHGSVYATQHGHLLQIEPKTLRLQRRQRYGAGDCEVAVAPNGVWFKDFGAGRLKLVGPDLGKPKKVVKVLGPNAITVTPENLWVTQGPPEGRRGFLLRYSPSGRLEKRFELGPDPQDLAWDGQHLWVNHYASSELTRFDPSDGSQETIPLGTSSPSGIAIGAGAVWVPSELAWEVTQIDREEMAAIGQTEIGKRPLDVTVRGTTVYVASEPENIVKVLDTTIVERDG